MAVAWPAVGRFQTVAERIGTIAVLLAVSGPLVGGLRR